MLAGIAGHIRFEPFDAVIGRFKHKFLVLGFHHLTNTQAGSGEKRPLMVIKTYIDRFVRIEPVEGRQQIGSHSYTKTIRAKVHQFSIGQKTVLDQLDVYIVTCVPFRPPSTYCMTCIRQLNFEIF